MANSRVDYLRVLSVKYKYKLYLQDGCSSFYCVLRCLIPGADKGRPSYGFQIHSLGKVYMKILQLGANCKLFDAFARVY